ncbi:MAG: proteasome accessory factor PafA2 family protein [Acidobacteriota bacterium]
MNQCLMGMETEYAATVLGTEGKVWPGDVCARRLMETARARLPHLQAVRGEGIFLSNGGRLYIDAGFHPEFSTPECGDPWELVRYVQGGDAILSNLAAQVASSTEGIKELLVFRGNVDYSGSHATWGCHESYLHRSSLQHLYRQIVPHLVSRVIYAGAGGFDPGSPGLEFTLSPRSLHIERASSESSTKDRGIFHTKNESLSGHGYGRLHLLCGDSLRSQTSLWLSMGTTCLAVSLAAAGETPGEAVRLATPVRALRSIVRDPACRKAVRLADGRLATALEIQHHYLAEVEAHLGARFMPDWAPLVCRRWRMILEQLERSPRELSTVLDWAIKRSLYENHLRRRGTSWRKVQFWNRTIRRLRRARQQAQRASIPCMESTVRDAPPAGETLAVTAADLLREGGMDRTAFQSFLRLRAELFEIETRFGQLGPGGVFDRLDQAGVLRHRVSGVEDIPGAMADPPARGRARLRGEQILRLSTRGKGGEASWSRVCDTEKMRTLDLSHPFEHRKKWQAVDGSRARRLGRVRELLADMVHRHS